MKPRKKFLRRLYRSRRSSIADAHASPQILPTFEGLSRVSVFCYSPESFCEVQIADLEQINDLIRKWPVTWVNVDGLSSEPTLKGLAKIFRLHPLAVEDVVHIHQRPKLEQYDDHLFIVSRLLHFDGNLATEQISLFLGRNFILTFQESESLGDSFEAVRERIRRDRGSIRRSGSDYLAYSLLDSIVDSYFPLLEQYGEAIEALEERIVVGSAGTSAVHEIHEMKRDLLVIRRVAWPLRDVFNTLIRDANPFIRDETRVYLRDCYDHAIRIIDLIEMDRELTADLMDLSMSTVSTKMNDIMRVLTVISTIFIPLNFVASIYGMNFHTESSPFNMPELNWRYGYMMALSVMLFVALSLVFFFWRMGWLRSINDPPPTPPSR